MEINKKELKEQEVRTMFITPALQQKGWAVSVNMREEYYLRMVECLLLATNIQWQRVKKLIIYYTIKVSPLR